MNALRGLRQNWRKRFFRWLDRRMPPARYYYLQRDKLYIFPTVTGFVCCGLVAILWMLGTNYQNNLILGLALLLMSLFVLAILRTHGNLSGLEIRFHDADTGFAGQEIAFHFDVVNHGRHYKDAVIVGWQDQVAVNFSMEALERKRVSACAFAPRRGYLWPGRLRVETVYPLGLLRCWTWLNVEARAVVFPQPEKLRELVPHDVRDEREDLPGSTTGNDEFAGLRDYRPGDPLKQVAWKQYARDQGLLSKEFSSHVSTQVWLAWESTLGLDTEQRLSTLCFWALHYDQVGCAYGLNIPGVRIEPGTGPAHKLKVLTALAVYELEARHG